jgi:hypothetical protein
MFSAATHIWVYFFLHDERLRSGISDGIECLRQSPRKMKTYLAEGDAEAMHNL